MMLALIQLIVMVIASTNALPIVDTGMFVIQGVSSCINGTGYCILGDVCARDIEFIDDETGGHCNGLDFAFTPKAKFICCRYNADAIIIEDIPTTTHSAFTITGRFSLIDEQQIQEELDQYDQYIDPANVIDVVGVVTDRTSVLELITRKWTGTFPARPTSPMPSPLSTEPTTPAQVLPVTPFSSTPPPEIVTVTDEDLEEHTTTESYNEMPTTFQLNDEDNIIMTEENLENEFLQTEIPLNTEETNAIIEKDLAVASAVVKPYKLSSPLQKQRQDVIVLPISDNSINLRNEQTEEESNKNDNATVLNESQSTSNNFDYERSTTHHPHIDKCGIKGSKFQIPDSSIPNEASLKEWCWIVAVMERRPTGLKYLCTGAIIDKYTVITTATCVKRLEYSVSSFVVKVGSDYLFEGDGGFDIELSDVVIHPKYRSTGRTSFYDIGLLRLQRSALFHANTCTVCMSEKTPSQSSSSCNAVGYSVNTYLKRSPSNRNSDILSGLPLLGISVTLSANEQCIDHISESNYGALEDGGNTLLCVQDEKPLQTRDSNNCQITVDRGSPVACEVNGQWRLVGIQSWSEGCRSTSNKQVYTNVTYFNSWIIENQIRWMIKRPIDIIVTED